MTTFANHRGPVTLGLISDTHLPDRWRTLPPTLGGIFEGVDLILHAGDVGELRVIDELSHIAPVVAVHGNDESPASVATLPGKQVIPVAGRRVLLWHGNYDDRTEEMAARQVDEWPPKLARWAAVGKQMGASVVCYGHTHIPTALEYDGVWLINGGAIAGGNHFMRQVVQSVARITLAPDAPPVIEHFDANDPAQALDVTLDEGAGFDAAARRYTDRLTTPELWEQRAWFIEHVYQRVPEAAVGVLRRLMYRVLDGELPAYGVADVVAEGLRDPAIPDEIKAALREEFGMGNGA
ncbi:MAG: metallophosphoesterase family protein [Anaerolineae bacterium]|nr:metallophosphoesterase family protein [Anaerolineae bacterium]